MKRLIFLMTFTSLMLVFNAQAAELTPPTIQGQGGTGLTINYQRQFTLDQNTTVLEDGVVVPGTRGQGGTGFKIRYRLANDVNNDLTAGTLEEINLINTHKGPLLSVDPFRIFNIDGLITADTFFKDDLMLQDLTVGDDLKVSGYIDPNGSLIVTRVEALDQPLTDWKLSGVVSQLSGSVFNIQNQVIDMGFVVPVDCGPGLANGDFVEVAATADPLFTVGSTLVTVTDVTCVDEELDVPPQGTVPVALEGIIDFEDLDLNNQFSIAGQTIHVDVDTVFVNGEIDDIDVGVKVEVEGLLDTTTNEILAAEVKFIEVRFRFEAPVAVADVVTDTAITVLGQTVVVTPQLRDEDNIMASGLTEDTQVEIRGFSDRDGNLFLTRVRDRGNPDDTDVSAEGAVTAISQPMIQIQGVMVDTSSSVFFDALGNPIDATTFFAQIDLGSEVGIELANWDALNEIISGGSLSLDEDANQVRSTDQLAGASGAWGIGTMTSLPDVLFVGDFDPQ